MFKEKRKFPVVEIDGGERVVLMGFASNEYALIRRPLERFNDCIHRSRITKQHPNWFRTLEVPKFPDIFSHNRRVCAPMRIPGVRGGRAERATHAA